MTATTLPSSSKLAMHRALRCKARSKRTGKPCQSPAVSGWAVCRMHGARGGAPKGKANGNYKTGEHTAELRSEKACPRHPSSDERRRGGRLKSRRRTVHGVDSGSVSSPTPSVKAGTIPSFRKIGADAGG